MPNWQETQFWDMKGASKKRMEEEKKTRQNRISRICRNVSIAHLIGVCCVWILIYRVSENWWLSAAMNYLPRLPYVMPAIILLVPSLICHRFSIVLNLLAIALVIGPIAGFQFPQNREENHSDSKSQLTIVSCNVKVFNPEFSMVLREIQALNPDIVGLQEATRNNQLFEKAFDDWHMVHVSEYWIASKYPIRLISECFSEHNEEDKLP